MKIAVVIPTYKVTQHILDVIAGIPNLVNRIFVIDDCCPESSGKLVENQCHDPRVSVTYHGLNKGVGGAMITGYRLALDDGANIIIKLDGDGQMNPALIPQLIAPIVKGMADYTKGNRFFTLEFLAEMPTVRILGNSVLSFVNKMASGYWNLMDPTNGFTAIHASVLKLLPLDKIDNRYFFESDILFRLYTLRAVVKELPMTAVYGREKSNLNIGQTICSFPTKHMSRIFKRLFYAYYLRDFNPCSLEIVAGLLLTGFGVFFGLYKWVSGIITDTLTPSGSIMLSALPVILGVQLLIEAIRYDVANVPKDPIHETINDTTP